MRVKEAAKRLEVSSATVYVLVATGKLRCVRIGRGRGTIRILEEHIVDYLQHAEPRPVLVAAEGEPAAKPKLRHLSL